MDELPEIIGTLGDTDGDTSHEELTCIGLEPGANNLVATVQVKLSSGYSGGLCTAGSTEYVAFWVDYDDRAGWTHAGTTAVRVHDLAGIPPSGLTYSVALPVDLEPHRVPCEDGPTLVKVRAILSWQAPPPPGNPGWVPTWGNREETLVEIAPGDAPAADDHRGFLESVA